MAVQEYQCISLVAGQLFGSEKKKAEVDAEVPQTAEQMQTAFSSVFGK